MWVGIATNAIAITIISASSILAKGGDSAADPSEQVRCSDEPKTPTV